jgi:hypothetical protein
LVETVSFWARNTRKGESIARRSRRGMRCGRLFVGGPGKVRLRPNRASRGSLAGQCQAPHDRAARGRRSSTRTITLSRVGLRGRECVRGLRIVAERSEDAMVVRNRYRPDSEVAEHQREVVRSLVRECGEFSIPLVVEPIWLHLRVKIKRVRLGGNAGLVRGIIESARSELLWSRHS